MHKSQSRSFFSNTTISLKKCLLLDLAIFRTLGCSTMMSKSRSLKQETTLSLHNCLTTKRYSRWFSSCNVTRKKKNCRLLIWKHNLITKSAEESCLNPPPTCTFSSGRCPWDSNHPEDGLGGPGLLPSSLSFLQTTAFITDCCQQGTRAEMLASCHLYSIRQRTPGVLPSQYVESPWMEA